jgi:Domain of unknown function (DUF929)
MAMGGSGFVVVIIIVFVAISLVGGGKKNSPTDTGTFAISPSVVAQVTAVPVSAMVKEGVAESRAGGATPPQKLPPKNPELTSGAGGLPEFLYMGGDYCPYCAAERWSLVMALSKFGTFSNLKGTSSSSTDVYPSTPTFSFYGSSFTSKYISFVGDEMYKNYGQNASTGVWPTLQAPTAQQEAIITEYDAPPYVQSSSAGGIPFLYIAGRFVEIGPQYVATNLTGDTFDTAAALQTAGTNTTSKEAEASAGYLVGDICAVTKDKPASVCSQLPSWMIGVNTKSKPPAVSVPAKGSTKVTTTTAKKSTAQKSTAKAKS